MIGLFGLGDVAGEDDAVGEAEVGGFLFEAQAVVAVAADEVGEVGVVGREGGDGFHRFVEPFVALGGGHPAEGEEHMLALQPVAVEEVGPLRAGAERRGVDAVGDDEAAFLRQPGPREESFFRKRTHRDERVDVGDGSPRERRHQAALGRLPRVDAVNDEKQRGALPRRRERRERQQVEVPAHDAVETAAREERLHDGTGVARFAAGRLRAVHEVLRHRPRDGLRHHARKRHHLGRGRVAAERGEQVTVELRDAAAPAEGVGYEGQQSHAAPV